MSKGSGMRKFMGSTPLLSPQLEDCSLSVWSVTCGDAQPFAACLDEIRDRSRQTEQQNERGDGQFEFEGDAQPQVREKGNCLAEGDVLHMSVVSSENACAALVLAVRVDLIVHVRHAVALSVGRTSRNNNHAVDEHRKARSKQEAQNATDRRVDETTPTSPN